MKRKCTALMTLLIFVASVFLPHAAALADTVAPAAAGTYTAYDATKSLGTMQGSIDGMKILRLKDGSDAGVQAYSLNMSRKQPAASPDTSGYSKVASATNQDWAKLVDKAVGSGATLRQDVLNVIWNGYPYFSGSWKGVDKNVSFLKGATGLSNADVSQLNNTAVTQQAIWTLTDGRVVGGTIEKYVNDLLAVAKKNPAPANFGLDLYSVTANKTSANLVTLSAATQKTASIQVTHHWQDANGQPLTGVKTPAISFALYPADPAGNTQPIATYNVTDPNGVLAFTLFDDEKDYVLMPVLSGETEGFTAGKAQTFSLKGDQGAMIKLDFGTTYTAPEPEKKPNPAVVGLGAELTLNDKAPSDNAFTLLLKDEAGNILQTKANTAGTVKFDGLTFDKEGTYNYTITMQIGNDSTTVYDKAVYKVNVVVTKGEDGNYVAKVTYEKNGVAYIGIPSFGITKPTTPTPTIPTVDNKTVSVTVNKVWQSDKLSTRPTSVSVQLYRDSKAYGSAVTLNSGNGWKYTWSNLESGHKWTVNETAVPSGYTKRVANSGNNWTITNTGKSPTVTTTTTPKVTTPTVKKTSNNGNKNTTSRTSRNNDNDDEDDDSTNDRSTPETGDNTNTHLWGTVAIIALSGMVLIAAVWLITRRRLHERK